MSKAQMAALILAAAGGALAPTVAGSLFKAAEAAAPKPYSHAVDLRRTASDAGVSFIVYGTRPGVDGGASVDVGQAKSCKPTQKNAELLSACMNVAALDCDW